MITFGSLFAGIGGIDLGLERCGMQCEWQVEIDDYANKVLRKHWPDVHRERDIRRCGWHNLKPVDIIAGGFPCQDISYAGRGAGIEGERSGLFFEAIRLVRELRPRYVLLENVAALLSRGLDRVLGALAEIGYDAEWHCIPAAYVGAPHIRDRTFVIGKEIILADSDSGRNVRRCRHEPRAREKAHQRFTQRGLCREHTTEAGATRGRGGDTDSSGRQCKESDGNWWSTEPNVDRVAYGVPKRVDRLRGLGNAVVPQVAELLGRRIIEMELT